MTAKSGCCRRKVIEGVYDRVECGDHCYLFLTLTDGRRASYGASEDVQQFEAPVGTRVRVALIHGVFLKAYEGPEYYCSRQPFATHIERAK
jgi:hypothetical protein